MRNKVLKTLLISASCLLCFSGIAGAEYINSVNYNYEENMVEISGKDFDEFEGQYATILVMQDKTEDDFVAGTDDASIENQATALIGEDGTFSYSFRLRSITKDGNYVAYINAGGSVRESKFTYTRTITNIYDEIMKAADSDAFAKLIVQYSASLNLDDTVFGHLDDGEEDTYKLKAAAIAFKEKSTFTATGTSASAKRAAVELLKKAVIKASYIEALNRGGKLDYVAPDGKFIDPEILGLNSLNETAYTLFTEKTKDAGKDKVLANIQKQNYQSVEAFLDGFVYEATIAAIKYNTADGTSYVKTILKDNNARNGFILSNYNSLSSTKDVDVELISGKAWSKDDIQDVLDTKEKTNKKDPESSGNSNSSSLSYGKPGGNYSQDYSVNGSTTPAQTDTFTDLGEVEWAKAAIEGLAEKGIVSGRGDGTYAPLDNVTRAEFMTLIVKALGLTSENATCDFADVKEGDWSYEYVAIGSTLGIASGYGNGYFGASDFITRQDAATMLYNAVTKSEKTLNAVNEGIDFADKAEISDYASPAVDALVKAGILSGANGSFMPKNNATRAEAAVMISNIITALGLEG